MKTSLVKIVLSVLLPGLISCGKLPTEKPGQEPEHFAFDFENASLDGFIKLIPSDSNASFVSYPARKGNKSLRLLLRTEDRLDHGNRVELGLNNSAKYQADVFYGWSFWVDTSYHDPHYCLLAQWQNLPDFNKGEDWDNTIPSAPPLHLDLVDSMLELNYNTVLNRHDPQTLGKSPVTKGVWNDIVVHVYWSTDNTGMIEAWLNGDPFVSSNDHKFYGPNLYSTAGNYFKFGLYRGHDEDAHVPLIAYFDELKIGSSYAEVAP